MEKDKKKNTSFIYFFKLLILIVIIMVLFTIINNTYSKYITRGSSLTSSAIANWHILVNGILLSNYDSETALDLDIIWIENQYIDDNRVAPTSKGFFDVEIESTGTETKYDYEISLNPSTDIPDFKVVSYKLNELIDDDTIDPTPLDNTNKITGTVEPEASNVTVKNKIRAYFEWYDQSDNVMNDYNDTQRALHPAHNPATIPVIVKVTQVID